MNFSTLFMVIFFCSISGCKENSTRQSNGLNGNEDSLRIITARDYFDANERSSLDSISKYNLDSTNKRCKQVLYVIYGPKKIIADTNLTIGEFNIRLIDFKYKSDTIRHLQYGVFAEDFEPILSKFKSESVGNMIYAFEINVYDKKINKGIYSEYSWSTGVDLDRVVDSLRLSPSFQQYLDAYKGKTHSNFITTNSGK